jgi:hypothetical protein
MKMQLVIELDPATGGLTVNGALDNKLVAYGMLEMAKEAIADFHHNKAKSGLVVPLQKIPPTNGHAS